MEYYIEKQNRKVQSTSNNVVSPVYNKNHEFGQVILDQIAEYHRIKTNETEKIFDDIVSKLPRIDDIENDMEEKL